MSDKILARELESATDIQEEGDVVVGWDEYGNKFVIIENVDDGRINQIFRIDSLEADDYEILVKRWKEDMNITKVIETIIGKDLLRCWAFPSTAVAMNWFTSEEESISSGV